MGRCRRPARQPERHAVAEDLAGWPGLELRGPLRRTRSDHPFHAVDAKGRRQRHLVEAGRPVRRHRAALGAGHRGATGYGEGTQDHPPRQFRPASGRARRTHAGGPGPVHGVRGREGRGAHATNSGKLLLPGSRIAWDIHYSASKEDITDFVEMAVSLYPKGQEPKYRQHLLRMGNTGDGAIDLPPNTIKATESFYPLRQAARIESFQPHMHLRGKAMSLEAILPSGQTVILSHVDNFTFNWHNAYVYADHAAPLLPTGTMLKDHGVARQHVANKNNPDPNVWVGYGDRTVDEMGHAWVNVTYLSDDEYAAEVEARRTQLTKVHVNDHVALRHQGTHGMSSHRRGVVTGDGDRDCCLATATPGWPSSPGRRSSSSRSVHRVRRSSLRSKDGGPTDRQTLILLGYYNRNKSQELGHSDRSGQPDRAGRSRLRPAHPLLCGPAARRIFGSRYPRFSATSG